MTRKEYLVCPSCDGCGAFSDNGNDPWAKSWNCPDCDGTGETIDAEMDAVLSLIRTGKYADAWTRTRIEIQELFANRPANSPRFPNAEGEWFGRVCLMLELRVAVTAARAAAEEKEEREAV